MTFKTQAIIIKRSNLGEADKIVTEFTKDFGKKKLIAKGVRKTLSKLGGHLELFCLSKIQFTKGKNLDILTAAEVQKCFHALRANLKSTNTAHYLAEITNKLLPEEEPHPKIFDLLDETLEYLDSVSPPLAIAYFETKLLTEIGFLPELYECVICQKEIKPDHNKFSALRGGLVCNVCAEGKPISNDAIKILRLFTNHHINVTEKLKIKNETIKEINRLTSAYLTEIHQNDFNAKKFINM